MSAPQFIFDGPQGAPTTIILAHGATSPADSRFMTFFASRLGAARFRVARFEFPYMAARRRMGIQRPPDKARVLMDTWREAVAASGAPGNLVIGGKSLGGRTATLVADELKVKGVVCLGYPFHVPGQPETARIEHLRTLATPTLIIQGTEDPFGGPQAVKGYEFAPTVAVKWIRSGNHSFERVASSEPRDHEKNWELAIADIAAFVNSI